MKNIPLSLLFTCIISLPIEGFELNNEINGNPLTRLFSSVYLPKYEKIPEINPDVDSSTLDMIERAGYPAEAHMITTVDGYILEVHRIRGEPGSTPVLLQHGLLSSSADWVITGKSKALAYLLADRGYDVWLGNARGNTYSRAHKTLSTTDSKFWDFSWNEMGLYDLPAVIEYITNLKNDSLVYVGHSMGTTMFYVMASKRPDIADRVRLMIALAPVAYLSHLKSPVKIIAPFADDIKLIAHFLGADEFLPQNILLKFLARYGCEIDTLEEKICANSMFVICGFDKAQFNETLMPVILSHSPAGTSTKTLVHYGQEINSGRFQAYDYGASKNREYYNNTSPPDYDISRVKVPVALFVADNDWLASSVDVDSLWKQLPNKIAMFRVQFPKFNHVDFLWGIDAPKLVYENVFTVVERYRNTNIKKISHAQFEIIRI
ncbi:lipase 3-like [Venturia canescens]|uniref:lipase 3-like n=1 Tax=Venturia canescens TaxID=32260 RepID=UPI001C9CF29D|nr:lipase 3-like [Venturia canescens]